MTLGIFINALRESRYFDGGKDKLVIKLYKEAGSKYTVTEGTARNWRNGRSSHFINIEDYFPEKHSMKKDLSIS